MYTSRRTQQLTKTKLKMKKRKETERRKGNNPLIKPQ